WSLEPNIPGEDRSTALQKTITVPFLLQLASMSPILHKALCSDVLPALYPRIHPTSVLPRHPDWFPYIEPGSKVPLPELLLKDMEQTMRSNSEPIRFLQSLENNILYLLQHVPSDDEFVHSVLLRLLLLIGRHNSAAHVIILEHVLLFSTLQDLVVLVSDRRATTPLSNAISLATRRLHTKSLESVEMDPARFWNNLYELLRWELSGKEVGKPVVRAISSNLTLLTEELESCTHAHNGEKICRILTNTLGQMTTHVQLDQYLKIARAIICFFFTLLYQEKDVKTQVVVCCALRQLLSTVCASSTPARTLALRELISSALLTPHAKLFGAKEKDIGQNPDEPSLLEENMKQVVGVMSHSSVFHAGVIGCGPRINSSSSSLTPSLISHHEDLLLSLLGEICRGEAMGLALYLVEIISPDVMYNGLPWLEEDFCKAPGSEPPLVQCTVRLLEIMSLGQLLPPPLSALYLLIPHVTPQHVVMLLRDCVWSYMRDHVPSPALFTTNISTDTSNPISWRDPAQSRPPPQYTDTMRFILRRNMAQFGPLYRLLFSHQSVDAM
ncbi:integrator complex subunit 5-like, partial [Diaphorina citri]|uniref:Integrator complex subunit 5-like n=1 Tax=Diaphorina citri TaxID=121845 RepID=A0A1S3D106_DIACI